MASAVKFRRAKQDDLAAIVAMLADDVLGQGREVGHETGAVSDLYLNAFDAIKAQPGNDVYVGEADGIVVATAQLTLIPNLSISGTLRAQIEGVRVASSQRGQGTGEALIRWLIERAREAGAGLVQLTTNKTRDDALRFYERLGFETSHEGMKLKLETKQ